MKSTTIDKILYGLLAVIAMIAITEVVSFGVISFNELTNYSFYPERTCRSETFRTRQGLMGECFIETSRGQWIPLRRN